jgi:hypothetical protein
MGEEIFIWKTIQKVYMQHRIKVYLLIVFSVLVCSPALHAQLSLSGWIDVGSNNVSEGLYLKSAGFGSYQSGKMTFNAGMQIDVVSQNPNILSGFKADIRRQFRLKKIAPEIQGFYSLNRFSDLLYEYNLGLLCNVNLEHFDFSLGTHFRTYGLTKDAAEEYYIETHKKIHENWNMVYLVAYRLKPPGHEWNVSLNVTNIDHFIISQETNPVIFLRGQYKVAAPFNLFAELWYKTAGSFNLSVNYFGFLVRTGIVWDIEL